MLHQKTQGFLNGQHQLFINNTWVNAKNSESFPSINPATGETIAQIAAANTEDVTLAVKYARMAFENVWQHITPSKKGHLMFKLADLMERDLQVLQELESIDNGKPLNKAKYDVLGAIHHFRYYAGWATKIEGSTIPVETNKLIYTIKEPLGVVGLIVPWNFPLMILSWKLAPALACGNTCLVKPAEETSLTALYLGMLIKEAGFPEGVVNILTGAGIPTGDAICRHPDVDKISFTGSTAVGRKIMEAAAQSNLKKVSLELGGKSPNVIFEDADLNKVMETIHWPSFYNSGQECTLGSRIYVQQGVYQKVIEALKTNAEALTIGRGIDNPDLGPIVSEQQMNTILKYVQLGKEEGAKLELGGYRLQGALKNGYFVAPTVFSHPHGDLTIVREEIFGPVVVVIPFTTFEEAVTHANDTNYGLAAAIWTKDISKAHRFAQQVKAGTIWINGYDLFNAAVPFGGFKESGMGKEMGKSAIALYTQEKAVWVAL